ncbi:transposase [Vibrio cholerae]|uniref:transposase n=1 Tax=Vibrio cholerae TaxID=666 RepID=UPI0028D96DCE|nr:hypothetical protein [Vibrio cholerae]EJL3954308.1 transposase [Vibrio cholerae]EJL6492646.1 transposase [Vibrio cholerae]EJL6644719.1 transposase [Vibrio cholerae]ELK0388712.1 transposase [Vibrio cholerae]
MVKGSRCTDEFKQEALNQVIQHGYSVNNVAVRSGISGKVLYNWVSKFTLNHRFYVIKVMIFLLKLRV